MTTTPISEAIGAAEIEASFGEGERDAALVAPALTIMDEWRRFGAFLKRPTLDMGVQNEGAPTVLARIYALDMAAMFVLIGVASALIAAGVYIPETALAGMEFTWGIIALVVIGAPVMEEIAFRGWLSGRPGPILALLFLGVGAIGATILQASTPVGGALLGLAGLAAAITALFVLRKNPAMGWFAKGFPAFFWLSTIAFALVHLANFEEGSLTVLLPLVLPQLILGTMLGYVRVRFALWAAIALHAAHNATALSIAAIGGQLG
ncbi:MAG: CPBP family glutamic-type intramembrane protease [Erythrobacter sp.]|uniref:CPBP family glutamic-type intramembrane protease n=1 Tax=Erythrobacter sp. TaxID=1042 RepID=UPI00326522C7